MSQPRTNIKKSCNMLPTQLSLFWTNVASRLSSLFLCLPSQYSWKWKVGSPSWFDLNSLPFPFFLWLTPSPDCWKGREWLGHLPDLIGERNQSFRWWIENLLSLEYMYTLWSSTYLTIPFPLFQWIENTLSIEYTRSDDFYPTLPFLLLLWSKPSQDSWNRRMKREIGWIWQIALLCLLSVDIAAGGDQMQISWVELDDQLAGWESGTYSTSFPFVSEFVTLFLWTN